MKRKPPAAREPQSVVEQMLEKLDAIATERDDLTAKLAELDAQVAAFETVLKTYDPSYVPLEIRRVQVAAPTLTPSAKPALAELTASAEAAAKKRGKAGQAEAESDATAAAPKSAKEQKAATTSLQDVDPKAAAAAARAKQKAKELNKKKKRLDDARTQIREYFGDIDKLDTLAEIIKSSKDGIPFREISEAFAARHPIDVSKPEVKKVYSDRLSALLSYMAKQGTVGRSEREGPEGHEKVWIWTRDEQSGNGSGNNAQATTEAAAE